MGDVESGECATCVAMPPACRATAPLHQALDAKSLLLLRPDSLLLHRTSLA
jgi:hypothetical protein